MTDDWRRKTYYGPRVLIDTQRILAPQFPDAIVCLSGAQIEMLRNLTQYLHRRSTWAESYAKTYYLAPSNEDWVTVQAIVADLEEKLMSTLCEDLITILEGQAASILAMQQCICHISVLQEQLVSRLPDMAGYVDVGSASYERPSDNYGAPSSPATDTEKCELAQAFFYWLFQTYTETLLPFANSTADAIVALLIVSSTFTGAATFVGLPVALAANIVLAIVAWGIDGAIANFTNWLWDSKDEIVCILYNNLPDYETVVDALGVFIDASVEITFLDKAVLKTMAMSIWHLTWVLDDQQTSGTWDASFIPGQCDTCNPLPSGCQPIASCDLLDWNGSGIECHDGRAWVVSSDNYYIPQTIVAPSFPAWLSLDWIPRSDGAPTANVRIGVRDTVSEIEYDLGPVGLKTVDVQRTDHGALPAATGGHACQLWLKQEVWYAEPVFFCLTDVDPT